MIAKPTKDQPYTILSVLYMESKIDKRIKVDMQTMNIVFRGRVAFMGILKIRFEFLGKKEVGNMFRPRFRLQGSFLIMWSFVSSLADVKLV